jgi:hypothetical protein
MGQGLGLVGDVGEELAHLDGIVGDLDPDLDGNLDRDLDGAGQRGDLALQMSDASLGLAKPILQAHGLVGEHQAGHQQHAALGHPADLLGDGGGLRRRGARPRVKEALLSGLAGDLEMASADGDLDLRHQRASSTMGMSSDRTASSSRCWASRDSRARAGGRGRGTAPPRGRRGRRRGRAGPSRALGAER